MRYLLLTFICIWVLSLHTLAQGFCTLSIKGEVHHALSDAPLQSAHVILESSRKLSVTDQHGHFTFNGLCAGQYRLLVSSQGFRSKYLDIRLDSSVYIHIHLDELTLELEAITIEGLAEVVESVSHTSTLYAADLERSRGQSLADALKDISGVNVIQTGPTIAKPVIHGMHSNRVLILNNGIRQEGQQWGAEHAPEIDPFVATQMTVVKGASAVRYGPDAIGGVIIVTPPALRSNAGIGGELNTVGMTNGRAGVLSGMLEGNTRGIGWRLQSTLKRSGNVRAADYYLFNTGMREFNFSGALGYTGKKHHTELFFSRFSSDIAIFRGAHIGNLTDLNFALQSPRPITPSEFSYAIDNPRQGIAHHLLKLSGYYRLGNNSKIEYQYGFQANRRQEYDIRRGGRSDVPALDLQLFTHTADILWEQNRKEHFVRSAGISGLLQYNENIPGTGIRPLVPNYNSVGLGVFWIEKYVTERWELEAGLRYDYRFTEVRRFDRNNVLQVPCFHFSNLSGTLATLYTLAEGLVVKSQIATAWRAPAPNELFSEGLHHGVAALEFGNDQLASEQAYKWMNTLQVQKGVFQFELSPYLNYIANYIFLEPQLPPQLTIRGAFPVFNYRQTNALFTGADASLRVDLGKGISWRSKASLIRASDVKNRAFLPWIPADHVENSLGWSRKHKKLPDADTYLSISSQSFARQFRFEDNRDFANPPAAYTLINLDMGHTIILGSNSLRLSASVRNLLNSSYRDYLNRFRYFADDMGRNVMLRIRYTLGGEPL